MERFRSCCRYVCARAPSQRLVTSQDYPLPADIRQCPYCNVLFTNETVYNRHWCWGSPKLIVAALVLLLLLWQIDTSTDFQIYKQASKSTRSFQVNLKDVVISEDVTAATEGYIRASNLCSRLTSNIPILPDQTEYLDQQTARMEVLIDRANTLMQTPHKPASEYEPILLDEEEHIVDSSKTHQRLMDITKHWQLARLFIERARKRLHKVLTRFIPSANITHRFQGNCECVKEDQPDAHHLNINTRTLMSMLCTSEVINEVKNSINDVCVRIYEDKEHTERNLSLLLKRIKPFSDLHEYYMKQRENRERKALLLAQDYFRIYAAVYLTYFRYIFCGGSFLHILTFVGLFIYTRIYGAAMNQKWLWKSRIATMVVIWLAEKIHNNIEAIELWWSVLNILWKPFAILSYLWFYRKSKYEPADTILPIREFTNITSQESKINKSVQKRTKQHLSYQKKNKYDKSMGLALDRLNENNNLKALIEDKYLLTILKNTGILLSNYRDAEGNRNS